MSNLLILLKNNFFMTFGAFLNKKKKNSIMSALAFMILGGIFIICVYSFQAYTMTNLFNTVGYASLGMYNAIMSTVTALVIISVMGTSGKSKTNDAELLLSLPIKKSTIVLSKTLNKYLFDLCFALLLILPYTIVYFVFSSFSLQVLLFSLLICIMLPLLCVGITYLFDFIISRLFNKSKYSNAIKSLLLVIIFIALFVLYMTKTTSIESISAESVNAYLTNRPLSYQIFKFIMTPNLLSTAIVSIVCIIPFMLGVLLYTINYGKSFNSYRSKNHELKFTNNNGSFFSMLHKEIIRYLNSTIWIFNTILGPLFIIIATALVSIFGINSLSSVIGIPLSLTQSICVLVLIFNFLIALTLISCSSISLEGSNLWILKSGPINEKSMLLAKACLNIVIVLPVLIICSCILAFTLHLSLINFIIILLAPITLNILLSVAGVLINLWLPQLNWTDEVKVVKQGFSTLVAMLLSFILTAIPIALLWLVPTLSLYAIAFITILIYIVLTLISIALLFTKGVKLYREL